MKKKVLILGSSSFSGSSMVNFLLNKKKFLIYGTYRRKKIQSYLPYRSNKNYKLFKNYQVDFLKKPKKILKIIKKIQPDYIIDFASICMVNESWSNPKIYFQTNVQFKLDILKHLKKYNFLKKYIYISTPEIFGSSNKFINEDNENYNPSTPYATSKLAAEILLKNYFNYYKLPVIVSRFSNFYGPGQPIYRLIPKIITCIDKKKKFPIEGSGRSKRNFIYSHDFCNGIYKVLTKGKVGNTYHFSGDKFYSVLDVIKTICDLKSTKVNKLIKKTKGRIGQDLVYKLGSFKTRKVLAWKPSFSLKKGLNEIIIYHKNNFVNISQEQLTYNDKNLKK
tara:strand:+ start:11382 stop:12386 length:1005 start_codon:yes stop_codon:yes gene_type:complete